MSQPSSPSHMRTIVEIVGVALAIVISIFGAGEYIYGPKIDRLEAERDNFKAKYDTLSQKTEGCLEPRLFYEDTLRSKTDWILSHAGKVSMQLERLYNNEVVSGPEFGDPPKVCMSYWNDVDSVGEKLLELSENERWEYTVGGESFYVTFEILDLERPLLVGRIYELNPIYSPVPLVGSAR